MARFLGLQGKKLRLAVWLEACLGIMIFGYNQASNGSVLGDSSFYTQFPRMDTITTTGHQKQYNSTIQGTVVALYTLLGAFGALGCTFLGDRLGRRMTILLANVLQGIGAILQASAFSFGQFIVGRIIIGLGTGGIVATVSVWQSEVSKAETRGEHVAAFGAFAGMGISLALWVAFGMSFTDPNPVAWRFTLSFTLFFSILAGLFIIFLPESPRWLCKVDRWEEARETLGLLHDEDPHGEAVNKQIEEIQQAFARSTHGPILRSMFTMGPQRVFHRVVIAATAQIFLQMCGVNSIAYYSPTIYSQQLKFSGIESGVLAASAQLVLIIGGFTCALTVDRFGRRNLMLGSAAGMCICYACLSALVSHPDVPGTLKAAVFFLYLFYYVYVLGFLGIPFLYASELAPTHIRAAVCGLSTAVSWLFNFLVAEVTPVAFNDIGWRYFLVYCCLNASFVPIIYFFFPETARRSLEEIDQIFESSKNIFDPVRVARTLPLRQSAELLMDEKCAEAGTREEINREEIGKEE